MLLFLEISAYSSLAHVSHGPRVQVSLSVRVHDTTKFDKNVTLENENMNGHVATIVNK